MQNHRKLWLDIAKGITIILIVVGHTSISNAISSFIYAFHMPLFFYSVMIYRKLCEIQPVRLYSA